MVYAYPIIGAEDTFYLRGERPNETYHRRSAYKEAGVTWDGTHWIVDDEQRAALGIERMRRIYARCRCGADETELVPESKAIVGQRVSVFCGHCDGRSTMTIEAVR